VHITDQVLCSKHCAELAELQHGVHGSEASIHDSRCDFSSSISNCGGILKLFHHSSATFAIQILAYGSLCGGQFLCSGHLRILVFLNKFAGNQRSERRKYILYDDLTWWPQFSSQFYNTVIELISDLDHQP
jgi:hypothetical protein